MTEQRPCRLGGGLWAVCPRTRCCLACEEAWELSRMEVNAFLFSLPQASSAVGEEAWGR